MSYLPIFRLRGAAALLFLLLLSPLAAAQNQQGPEDAPRVEVILRGMHKRMIFEKPLRRVAVGDPEILDQDTLSTTELLLRGRAVGRTSVIVWFTDDTLEEFLVDVERDLRVLRNALEDVHPGIFVEMAPDRDAIILRGTVPDLSYSQAAEDLAQRYLDAGSLGNKRRPSLLTENESGSTEVRVGAGEIESSSQVINLLRLEVLPEETAETLQKALNSLGATGVQVTSMKGAASGADLILLEGTVPDQIMLVRVLSVSVRLVTGSELEPDSIQVLSDESGALSSLFGSGDSNNNLSSQSPFSNVGAFGGGGSNSNQAEGLQNRIEANVGRAKAIALGKGQILSFIQVEDIPQVRVSVRFYQIDRSRLRSFNSDLTVNLQDSDIGPPSPDITNVLASLAGSATNTLNIGTKRWALNSALSLLETAKVAKSLSEPSLMVLSGELATFQVGGSIPIATNFATGTGLDQASGVFNSVSFADFGIQIGIRPLVGQDGTVTLDINPSIVKPDAGLTSLVRDSTGSTPATIAFETNSMHTTARLQDGQALLLGGLLQEDITDSDTRTPGIADFPLFGNLFRGFSRDDKQTELVIVVDPVILRDPLPLIDLWIYPSFEADGSSSDLLVDSSPLDSPNPLPTSEDFSEKDGTSLEPAASNP